LAAYTLWLLAFPMQGVLLGEQATQGFLLSFLLPHVLALLIMAATGRQRLPEAWFDAAVGLTMALSLVFPLVSPEQTKPLLLLIGLASALVMLKVGSVLRASSSPPISAALGLILGNVLLFPVVHWDWSQGLLAALVSLPLAVVLQPAGTSAPMRASGWVRYLPFIFVYSVVSGLRYDIFLQAPAWPPLTPGADLAGYILAVLAASWLVMRDRDLALALGIVFGMLSLSFGLVSSGWTARFSVLTMQAAAGFVDLFVLALLLAQPNWRRAFASGIAAMCSGIAAGEALAGHLQGMDETVTMAGYGALTVAVLALYIAGRRKSSLFGRQRLVQALPDRDAPMAETMSAEMIRKLSAREKGVLELVSGGSNYRDAAATLCISESSVKTYMRRIFEKLGVSGKQELLERLSQAAGQEVHRDHSELPGRGTARGHSARRPTDKDNQEGGEPC